MKLEVSWQIFEEKCEILNFMNISTVGADLLYADGRTNGQMHRYDEASSRFSRFFERA